MSKKVSIKGSMGPEAVASILDDLLKSFRKGQIVIQNRGDVVVLKPSKAISIELEAVSKKDKEKLVIELDWEQEAEVSREVAGLRISSEVLEPLVEECEEVVCCVASEIPGKTAPAPAAAAAPAGSAAMAAPMGKPAPNAVEKAGKEEPKAKK